MNTHCDTSTEQLIGYGKKERPCFALESNSCLFNEGGVGVGEAHGAQ